MDSMSNKKRKNFIRNFYKIASTSVGRTLLYRLLLEIRRTDTKNNNGCIDSLTEKVLAPDDLDRRNACRRLGIITPYKTRSNSFNQRKKSINFYPSKDTKKINALGEKIKDKVEIIKTSRTDDVGLFHEMLHWFHTLREPERKKKRVTNSVWYKRQRVINFKNIDGIRKVRVMDWTKGEEKSFI